MPTTKNAMTRYQILDELLSNQYHNYSLDDLTDEVNDRLAAIYPDCNGVVRRTIEKDIFYLEHEGPFMVDIKRYTVNSYSKENQNHYIKHCLRYSNPTFSIFKKEMNSDEEYLLREVLSLLGQFEGLPTLKSLENLRLGLGLIRNHKHIISLAKNPFEKSNLIGELFTAISQCQVIKLQYHRFGESDNIHSIVIHPYLLKEFNRRWYLYGAAQNDGKLLHFGLERINSIEPLPSCKYMKYDGNINDIFNDIIGVTLYHDSPIYAIYLWVSDSQVDYVATKPLHKSQQKVTGPKEKELRTKYPMIEGGTLFRIDCKYNYELIRELCSYGKNLIVLEPFTIREKIFTKISEMKAQYEKLKSTSLI